MQELDIAQKVLEDHKDVFADIVNGLLFQGREVVKVTDLEGSGVVSSYKATGQLRRKERDVAKYWKGGQIRIAMFGFENQKKSIMICRCGSSTTMVQSTANRLEIKIKKSVIR